MGVQYPSYSSNHEPPTLADLIRTLFREFTDLVQQHIELGKSELREDAGHYSQVGAMFLGAALMVQLGAVFMGLALVYALALVLPPWLAAVIIMAVFFGTGAVLFVRGRSVLRKAPHHPNL